MLKIIACATNKGGEGKTQTSIIFSEYIALILNKKVLCIDLDPQANFSKYFLDLEYDTNYKSGKIPPIHPEYDPKEHNNWDGRSSIANIFFGEEVIPYPTPFENIEMLPAHSMKLQDAEAVTRNEVLEKVHLQLKRFVELEEVQEAYDFIIIDTPPSKGPLTISAIKACSHMIIPSQMEEDSIDGVYGMMQLWKQETYNREATNPIVLAGIIANKVKNANLHNNFYDALKIQSGTKDFLVDEKIKERIIYAELRVKSERPKSVFELSKNNPAYQECIRVCETIMGKIL